MSHTRFLCAALLFQGSLRPSIANHVAYGLMLARPVQCRSLGMSAITLSLLQCTSYMVFLSKETAAQVVKQLHPLYTCRQPGIHAGKGTIIVSLLRIAPDGSVSIVHLDRGLINRTSGATDMRTEHNIILAMRAH